MAFGVLSSAFALPPPATLLAQLLLGSAVVGCTDAHSIVRPVALPVVSACVYSIVTTARHFVRPRWASLLGGASFMFLLQYMDLALIGRWSFDKQGPADARAPAHTLSTSEGKPEASLDQPLKPTIPASPSFLERLEYGWNTMWSLRHLNTPYQVKNVPPYYTWAPEAIPSKGRFLLMGTLTTVISYLILDLLAQQPPNPNAPAIFHKDLIPLFSRLGEVTLAQLKLRAFSIGGFAVTFWCIISGYQAAAATIGIALGISEPKNWRPPLGILGDAYSLRNLWGKVWHQCLRRIITSPAKAITCDILGMPPRSTVARLSIISLSFGISGLMHHCASMSAGMPMTQTNVLQFFATQAFGCIIEEGADALYKRLRTHDDAEQTGGPSPVARALGYIWVMGFMTWSGPIWLYPQASRPPPAGAPAGFLPYSLIKASKTGSYI